MISTLPAYGFGRRGNGGGVGISAFGFGLWIMTSAGYMRINFDARRIEVIC